MKGPGPLKRPVLVITAAVVLVLVVAACTIQLRGDGETTSAGSTASRAADPLAAKLEHCRTVTYEQLAEVKEWPPNLEREPPPLPEHTKAPAVNVSPNDELQPKNRSRLPRDWPLVATPESE